MTSNRKTFCWFSVLTSAFFALSGSMIAARAQGTKAETPQTNEIRILLTAVDKDGRFVATLRADDLRILDEGAPQTVIGFQQIKDRTVSLAILIDASASQARTLPAQKLAATSFVDSIIRPDRDEAAVAAFTGMLTVEQKLTNNVMLLREAIARTKFVPPAGYVGGGMVISKLPPVSNKSAMVAGSTAIWDSVVAACNDLLSHSAGQTRRAIILLTDGMDTSSKSKMSTAIDRAIQDNVAIYSIGIGDTDNYEIDRGALRKLSEQTGGRAFFPKKTGDLTTVFADIGQVLRTQYVISYNPTGTAGPAGKIKVELVNPILRKSNVQLYYQQTVLRK